MFEYRCVFAFPSPEHAVKVIMFRTVAKRRCARVYFGDVSVKFQSSTAAKSELQLLSLHEDPIERSREAPSTSHQE
jgi:hypothetical protein